MAARGSVAGVVCVAMLVAACGRSARTTEVVDDRSISTVDGVGPTTEVVATSPAPTIRVGPLTPLDPTRIRPGEAAAIVELGRSGASEPSSTHAHGHGGGSTHIDVPLFTGDAATFANQWLGATTAVSEYDTLEEIRALGFVRASAPGPGVGTHWVLWSRVAQPFDPARPAMLLYDEASRPAQLVGYSYWVQSPDEPEGFAGPNDRWHQHTGLCVVNGWVDREEAAGPEACAGTYLAGGDLWMLHAWVVAGFENRLGKFAAIHPRMCPTKYGTPDIVRCPEESLGIVARPPAEQPATASLTLAR